MTNPAVQHKDHAFPLRYLIVTWLLVLSAVAFLDRTNISIAGAHISREFGIDNTRLGWVFSAFLLGYAAFQVPGGVLARRYGPRRVLALSLTWWGIFISLAALVPAHMYGAFFALVMMRFLLGAGEATMYPAMSCFVERWFPIRERGKANGIIFGGVGLGSGLAPPVATAIIVHYGWHVLFFCCGGVGLLAGLIWYLIARDTPEEHPGVGKAELDWIESGRGDTKESNARRAAEAAAPDHPRQKIPWSTIFGSKEVLGLSLSYFTFGYVAWIFFSWFYIYLSQTRGLNLRTSAIYSMFPFIAMTLGSLTGGVISDWLTRHVSARAGRCIFPACSMALTAVLLIVGSHAAGARTATAVLALGAGALYFAQSSYWSVAADFGGEHAGVVSGVMNSACQVGGATTASLTPLLAVHFGWNASFMTGTALALVGACAWLVINPVKRIALL